MTATPPGTEPTGAGMQQPGPKRTSSKGGKGAGIVVLLLLLAAAGGVAFVVWTMVGGGAIVSKAEEHLPAECSIVSRLDLAGMMKVPAVVKHVLPVLDAQAAQAENKGKLAKLLVRARLNPKKDLHSVAVCINGIDAVKGSGSAVFVVGGSLVPGALLKAMKQHANEGEVKETEIAAKPALEFNSTPTVYAVQADDAALIIGNNKALVAAAVPTSDAYKTRYKLANKGHVAVVATKAAAKALPSAAAKQNPLLGQLLGAERMSIVASLAPGELELRLGMANETSAAALAVAAEGVLVMSLAGGSLLLPPMLKGALEKRKIEAQGKDVVAAVPIPAEAIEMGAKSLAAAIQEGGERL